MVPPQLEALLILQDRDGRRRTLESQLKGIPVEKASIEQRIVVEKASIEEARGELNALELRRKGIETDIRSVEEQIGRYRSQQVQVRKNEEYQALTHEIERGMAAIDQHQETEIQLLYDIDAARVRFKDAEAALRLAVVAHEERLRLLDEAAGRVKTDLEEASAAVEQARGAVKPDAQRLYDRLAHDLGLPVVAQLVDHKCGGCHLKISSGIEVDVRKCTELTSCDQCGRILYWQV